MQHKPDYIFITNTPTNNPVAVCQKLPAGSVVILRDYELDENTRENLARTLKKICTRRKLRLLVAKTPELAQKIKADGMHLPEFMAKSARKLKQKHPNWLITTAAHSRMAATNAAKHGADAVLISPVFQTNSHPNKKPLGIYKAQKMVPRAGFAYALGGCDKKTLPLAKAFGFQGVAFVSAGF